MREQMKRCPSCKGIVAPCKKRFGVYTCMCCGKTVRNHTISSIVEPRIEKRGQTASPWDKVGGRV